jgi:8-oxo-dGTP pyrophosphatase MutT (NUDIX family)
MSATSAPGAEPNQPEADYCWLDVAGASRGRVVPAVAAALRGHPDLFAPTARGFALRDAGMSVTARSALLQEAALRLRAAGLVPGWRNEACALVDESGLELARFERGVFRTLGLQNRAVHVNGFRADGRLWIARRSALKLTAPGKLDNFAAGAIAAGETPAACAHRELWEEAGVPADLSAGVVFTGSELRSLRPLAQGYHDEILLCAALELPAGFRPACRDGEVAEFLCLEPAEVHAALRAGEFSIEAALVLADWFARASR